MALVQQLLTVAATYMSENVGWTATNALRADLLAHCLGLDMAFHKAHTPGELIERMDGDVTALANFFSQFVILVLGNVLLLIGVLALLFREDWRVGAALTLFALLALAVLRRSSQFRGAGADRGARGQRDAVRLPGGAAGRHRTISAPTAPARM